MSEVEKQHSPTYKYYLAHKNDPDVKKRKAISDHKHYLKHKEECSNRHKLWEAKNPHRKVQERRERFKREIGEIGFNILIELAKEQQFIEDSSINAQTEADCCKACGSKADLIEHHITYCPVKKVILCKRCHTYLHLSLLNARKCKADL